MLRRLCPAIVLAFALAVQAAAGADQEVTYLSAIEDLPLMAGLAEAVEDKMVFDTPSGRIVQSYATGRVTRGQVLEFYAATLPQLGWNAIGPGRFRRESEALEVDFPAGGSGGGPLTVRFALAPATD